MEKMLPSKAVHVFKNLKPEQQPNILSSYTQFLIPLEK